jgi:hypothetical protein
MNFEDLGRAYLRGRGESVTRSDRRRRELGFEVRLRRSPARAHARRENLLWFDKDASLFQSSEKQW